VSLKLLMGQKNELVQVKMTARTAQHCKFQEVNLKKSWACGTHVHRCQLFGSHQLVFMQRENGTLLKMPETLAQFLILFVVTNQYQTFSR